MVESVLVGTALVEDVDEGLRCDESEVHWDSCEPLVDDAGRVTLGCAQRHEWPAEIVEDPSRAQRPDPKL
jgi:hypothetical protein